MVKKIETEQFCLYQGDCVKVCRQLPSETVGFVLFSPPFVSLYAYSDDPRDLGNSRTYEEFFTHYSFLVKELYRLLQPGRICAVHTMELPTFKSSGEEIGLRDFPGDLIRCHVEQHFIFHSRHVIWKDPLIAATRTKAIGLAHKQIVKDSAMCRTGIPDYILAFRKPGENPKPIRHSKGLQTYYGSRSVPHALDGYLNHDGEQGKNKRSHWVWQQYASPVWFDIRQTKMLPYRAGREEEDEKHIAPLQLDVIERCMELWSTEGDVVLTPFLGIGSEAWVAVRRGRKAIGVELKESYWKMAARNLRSLSSKMKVGQSHE